MGVEGKPRVKLYTDEKGDFNGEALVVYFKKESVELAIMMTDDYEFRIGDRSNGNLSVTEADMSFKKNTEKETVAKMLVRKDRKAAERNRAELSR
jgi:HIV Tat-specific factor 1